jgi:hypothetical protein
MATLTINRTREYLNRLRDYGVYIDGKKVGTIANGETKIFNVSSGHHLIFTKIDWCSSPSLSIAINENEEKILKVGGFKYGSWLMPTTLIIIILSYFFKLKYDLNYLFYLVIPVFLLLIFYLTLGRKKYLTLIEII